MSDTGTEADGNRAAVPLTILTGFLGAGKTTLLKRLLTGDHGLRIAVLVNDFGALNIDADLVVGIDSNVVSLANGCVCCTTRDDLLGALEDVLARPEQPQYVILEASGVADPAGIAMTFHNHSLRERVRLDSSICVLDAEQVFSAPEQMKLKLFQIAFSDLLVLNKIDLVDSAQLGRIRDWLDEHFSRYRLLEARHCDVPLEILLAAGRFDASDLHELPGKDAHDASACRDASCPHDHAAQFSTWSFSSDRPMKLDILQRVAGRLPTSIYRCKGVVFSKEEPARRAVLQVVGKRVDITFDGPWGDQPPATRIVVIGAPGAADEALLQLQFESCLAEFAHA